MPVAGDTTPARIYFASDRDGSFQAYSIDLKGSGRRETRTFNGAFDPHWIPGSNGGLLFGGFADLSFNIYVAPPINDVSTTFALAPAESLPAAAWTWGELSHPQYARADGAPYERKFSLDFAAGDAAVAPGLGSAQGAVFVFSDLLSDHLMYVTLSSFQGNGFGNLVDNVNGSAFYLNQSRRINWGVGVFRQRGLFYEGDFNTLFEETSYGAFAQVRYPFTRFRRLAAECGGAARAGLRVGWRAAAPDQHRGIVGTARLSALRLRRRHTRLAAQRRVSVPDHRVPHDRLSVWGGALSGSRGRVVRRLRSRVVPQYCQSRCPRLERTRIADADRAAPRLAARPRLSARVSRI